MSRQNTIDKDKEHKVQVEVQVIQVIFKVLVIFSSWLNYVEISNFRNHRSMVESAKETEVGIRDW